MSERVESVFEATPRSTPEIVARQVKLFADTPAIGILERLPMGVIVFNTARQIVYANDSFSKIAQTVAPRGSSPLGQRLGEALSCLGADLGADGCGSSELCRTCRATNSLAAALLGQQTSAAECSITRHGCGQLENLDFRIWIWRLPHGDEVFQAAVLSDIRAEKRLALMERIFYHDILNLVSGMQGICQLMREEEEGRRNAEVDLLSFAVDRVSDLILSQREFSQAERGEYEVVPLKMGALAILGDITALMRREPSCRGKTLALAPQSVDAFFTSDRKLVTRILVNMQKNALEATPAGGVVTTGCDIENGFVRFWVHNPGVMPEEARTQLFRRTFSTKGQGRGLGTYGMKLFAENYLGGKVGFTTDAESGTRFFVLLPQEVCA